MPPSDSVSAEIGRAFAGASICWSPFTSANSSSIFSSPDSIPPSSSRFSSGTSNSIVPATRLMMSSSSPT